MIKISTFLFAGAFGIWWSLGLENYNVAAIETAVASPKS
jgi:hypothetical protein